jgi:hypothetical protein
VAVINQTLARILRPGLEAVGQMITQDGGRKVVAVVAGPAYGSGVGGRARNVSADAANWRLFRVEPSTRNGRGDTALATRSCKGLNPLTDKFGSMGLSAALNAGASWSGGGYRSHNLLTGFAGFALVLASLGIYAMISYSVNQRVQEIVIRITLGPSATDLQRHILLGTLGLPALGSGLGMAASRAFVVRSKAYFSV